MLTPSTTTVSVTARVPVLTATVSVPTRTAPGIVTVIVPPSRPAIPAGARTNRPLPLRTWTPPVALPRSISTPVAKTRVVLGGAVPAGAVGLSAPVTCSKPKTPRTDWPAMVIVALLVRVPSWRRREPAAMS